MLIYESPRPGIDGGTRLLSCDRMPASLDGPLRLVVQAATDDCIEAARSLAAGLGLPWLDPGAQDAHWALVVTPERLELRAPGPHAPGPVWAEFVAGAAGGRLRRAGRRGELLARAAGLASGTRTVIDATAGLGGDASLLAVLGCRVTAIERHPVVAALLRDGLRRAQAAPVVGARLGDRLQVVGADARSWLATLAARPADERPDAVLIDPMFPAKRGTAASRKEMQLFRLLVGGDEDAAELLALARAVARRRVVVKRHAQAPPLGGERPDVVHPGASTRFDVYVRAAP
jgi:16S rRNA (guanine1516-N2)-methyltransferase